MKKTKTKKTKKNPFELPPRKIMLDKLAHAHGYLRNFVGNTEAYGRDYAVPFTDADIRSIADYVNDMREDIKFIKRYYGV